MNFSLADISTKEKIILVSIAILLLLIPAGTYALSLRFKTVSSASSAAGKTGGGQKEVPNTSSLDDLKTQLAQKTGVDTSTQSPTPEPTPEVFFGPTLKFKIILEGRPTTRQATKLFVGIASGKPATGATPQYILSYQVDVPDSGDYTNLSLAGLTQGSTYTAYLKGPAQIATSSSFLLNPTINDLGTKKLITGDVNEDNIINQLDYDLLKAKIGTTPKSSNWNPNLDFNLDNIVNSWDLGIISAHLGTVGESGEVKSTITELPTGFSDIDKIPIGGPSPSPLPTIPYQQTSNIPPPPELTPGEGYWFWVPKP